MQNKYHVYFCFCFLEITFHMALLGALLIALLIASLVALSAAAGSTTVEDAFARLHNASNFEDLDVHRDLFLLRVQQFVQSAGTEDARKSPSGLSGHCLWPPEPHDRGYVYDGRVNPQAVQEHEATENEKRCLPRCTVSYQYTRHDSLTLVKYGVASATYVVLPDTRVVVGTSCYELHRLDMCLFALRSGGGFGMIRERLAMRKWMRDAGWMLDQDRNGTTLLDVLPFLNFLRGIEMLSNNNFMFSFAFGC